jgi:hypothetical protein
MEVVQVDPDPQTRRRKIHCKQELIINSLQRFYSQHPEKDELLKLLEGTSAISLRLIDWFVTNYAKEHSTSYILNGQEFLVYMNYKSQLKAYSKKLFDPFCRRERILFQIPGYPAFLTTVGKLNFFRWAVEKGVLNYITLNLATIEKEMNTLAREVQKARKASSATSTESSTTTLSTATTTSTTSTKSTRKRTSKSNSSSPSGSKLMQKHEIPIEVRFD